MSQLSREDVFGGVEFLDKLLDELETMFPGVNPRPDDAMAQIMYRAGQRSVVEYIQSKKDT